MTRKRTAGLITGALIATTAVTLVPLVASADQVILDDLIVDGSACIGQDCVNGESFGFDTIRIKENNLRIKAQDTSSTASFPTQDWQITFNDSTNGGANKFSIDAITPSTGTPFTIEASNQNHALYVDDGGRIGFGTNTPVVDLHVKSGNTPTLRLEQDGTSGFTPQTWDVAGNEANFFIRDATNGSTLPFRIEPGAASNVIYIENDEDIGFGTTNPDTNLDVLDSGNVQLTLESTTSGQEWRMSNNGNQSVFRISEQGSGVQEMDITEGATGDVRFGGDCISLGNGAFHIPAVAGATVTAGACPP